MATTQVLLIHGVGEQISAKDNPRCATLLGVPEQALSLHDWSKRLDTSWLDGKKRRRFFKWNPMRKLLNLDVWGDRVDDVLAYFLDKRLRTAAIAELRSRLSTLPTGTILVAHSLGSVLLWQALQTPIIGDDGKQRVFKVILLGSPIAMRGVRFLLWLDGVKHTPHAQLDVTNDPYAVILSGGKDPIAARGRRWCKEWPEPDLPLLGHDLFAYLKRASKYVGAWGCLDAR